LLRGRFFFLSWGGMDHLSRGSFLDYELIAIGEGIVVHSASDLIEQAFCFGGLRTVAQRYYWESKGFSASKKHLPCFRTRERGAIVLGQYTYIRRLAPDLTSGKCGETQGSDAYSLQRLRPPSCVELHLQAIPGGGG